MSYDEILAELRKNLPESEEEQEKFLRTQAEKFAREGNTDGVKASAKLLTDRMSDEQKAEIERITHVDGMRLDEMHNKIVELINSKNIVEAKSLAERLYKKIIVEFKETEKAKFVSLRNPFEDNLCQLLFKTDKTLQRTPFDFGAYLTTYAYIVTETGSPLDAIPVLEKAIDFNPVDVGPKLELAEVYKLLQNKKQLLNITRDTLRVASSPVVLARCYANVGYILTVSQDYEDASAFYTASTMLYPHPAIPHEMQHLADLKGTPLRIYSAEEIMKIMEKYDIYFGFSQDAIKVSAELSAYYLEKGDIPNALKSMKMTYIMTQDEQVKNLILKYDPKLAQQISDTGIPADEGTPDIKMTVNNGEDK